MQYTEGQLGRVFVVRIDDGEDMLVSLHQFINDKGIQAGSITLPWCPDERENGNRPGRTGNTPGSPFCYV